MAIYLVDYENVGMQGIRDCSQLTEKDTVAVFFTSNCTTVGIDFAFAEHPFKIKPYKVPAGDQSLDKHLIAYLGGIMASDKHKDIYIVSKDKGYDSIIKFLIKCYPKHWDIILRIEDITETPGFKEKRRKKADFSDFYVTLRNGYDIKSIRNKLSKEYVNVMEIIYKHKRNKNKIYAELVTRYGEKKAQTYYNCIKKAIPKKDGNENIEFSVKEYY